MVISTVYYVNKGQFVGIILEILPKFRNIKINLSTDWFATDTEISCSYKVVFRFNVPVDFFRTSAL